MSVQACFVSASGQNAFFGELADLLRGALEETGVATSAAVDHFPALEDNLVYVLVPHEFTALTEPAAHPRDEHLRRAVVINTEQPGTSWFEEATRIAAHAGVVADINPTGCRELRRRGIDARLMQLGYPRSWDFWGGDDTAARPVDVTFMGGHTPRRARALSRCGSVLAGRRTAIHLVDSARPLAHDSPGFLAGERKWRHLAATKLMINVHRATNPYFEWQRVVEAVANGCVVVTEHSLDCGPLRPNEHFVSAGAGSMPFVVEALLEDEERLASLRRAAYDALRELMPLSTTVSVLREAIEDAARQPIADGATRGATLPAPRRVPNPPPWAQVFEQPSDTDLLRRGLKNVLLTQRRLERRLDRIERGGEAERAEVTTFGPYARRSPRVSVVLTLYNYEDFVREALASAALSEYEDLEVVVVDDASTDASLAAARETLDGLPWLAAKLVARGGNHGLPAARNLGLEHARGEFIFSLDADNAIYSHALGRLVAALDDEPDAAFAYGILETFDVRDAVGLLSWGAWDPVRLRYGNYIDAMALLRRAMLEQVGGYTTDQRLYGWEDFALWCELAERGLHGVHVPEIVGRYRTGPQSMIGMTNVDTGEAWSVLLDRYPFLRRDPG